MSSLKSVGIAGVFALFGVAAVLLAFYAALGKQSVVGTRAVIMGQTCLVMKA